MTEKRPILSLKRKPADVLSSDIPVTGKKPVVVSEKGRQPVTSAPSAAAKPTTPTPVVTVNPVITPTDPPVTVKKKKKKNKPMKPLPVDRAVAIMTVHWPALFGGDELKLMRIGILRELYGDKAERDLPISGKMIRRCLMSLVRVEAYRQQMQEGAPRYDRLGQVSGTVTASEQAHAEKMLAWKPPQG